MVDFRKIEEKWQKKWADAKLYEPKLNKGKKKFYIQVAYPYPSGAMHIGHARTYTFPDIVARYKRMLGFNVLLPMGWHVTGTPVLAQTELVKERNPKVIPLLKNVCKIPEKDFKELEEPKSFVNYFVNKCKMGYKAGMNKLSLGFDWSRELTTMDVHYNKFIEWQYNNLKKKKLILKGKYPIRYCPKDKQAVGDHDLKEGEGAGIQEFTLLKFKINNEYLVAATLRPETVFGQTNLWISPDIIYIKAKAGKETWILSKDAFEKLKYQRSLKEAGKVKGKDLIGKYALAPGINKKIIILPSSFVDPEVGTGIVTSVPSDAPYDYIALLDMQKNEKEIKKYNLNVSEIKKIKPIAIINTKEYGDLAAVKIHEKLKFKNQTDPRLKEATQEIYKAGFHTGVMKNAGKYSGKPISKVKDLVKKDMIKAGKADTMYELESKNVICRCGTKIVVSILADQWFLKYSDENWKNKVRKYILKMNLIPDTSRTSYAYTVDWLENKPCARKKGLGTKLPFDKDWIVEPLSDSTIYFAYFTISNIIKTIDASKLNDSVFDYIFFKKGNAKAIASETKIPESKLKNMKEAFEYWYPLDFNVSANELIPNHMTFTIFHHAALFPEKYWLKGEIALGLGTLEGQKMSSSKGHLITVSDIVKDMGADQARLFLMNFVEPWQDFDWRSDVVKSTQKIIKNYFGYVLSTAKKVKNKTKLGKLSSVDKWILSKVNSIVKETTEYMNNFLIRKAIQTAVFNFMKELRWYERRGAKSEVQNYVLNRWARLVTPIIPHFAEEVWESLGNKGFVSEAEWPRYDSKKTDKKAEQAEEAVKNTIGDIQNIINLIKKKPKKLILYTIPPELEVYKSMISLLESEFKLKTEVYAVNDAKKYDPEGKSKKAKPGKPGIYLE